MGLGFVKLIPLNVNSAQGGVGEDYITGVLKLLTERQALAKMVECLIQLPAFQVYEPDRAMSDVGPQGSRISQHAEAALQGPHPLRQPAGVIVGAAFPDGGLGQRSPVAQLLGMRQRLFDGVNGPVEITQVEPHLALIAQRLDAPLVIGPRHMPQRLVVQLQALLITSLKQGHPAELVQRPALAQLIVQLGKGPLCPG